MTSTIRKVRDIATEFIAGALSGIAMVVAS